MIIDWAALSSTIADAAKDKSGVELDKEFLSSILEQKNYLLTDGNFSSKDSADVLHSYQQQTETYMSNDDFSETAEIMEGSIADASSSASGGFMNTLVGGEVGDIPEISLEQARQIGEVFSTLTDEGKLGDIKSGEDFVNYVKENTGFFDEVGDTKNLTSNEDGKKPDSSGSTNALEDLEKAVSSAYDKFKETQYTDSINFGTFNVYGSEGTDSQEKMDYIGNLAAQTDILGLQEAGGHEVQSRLVEELSDTHSAYLGNGTNPIFFNKDKFELIDAREEKMAEGAKESDPDRTTTFAVLRDKETGALTLVTNRHQQNDADNVNDADGDRAAHMEKTNQVAEEIMSKYPIDARVDLGDFNSAPTSEQLEDYDYYSSVKGTGADGEERLYGTGVDLIMAKSEGSELPVVMNGDPTMLPDPQNGDFYAHQPVIQSLSIGYDSTKTDEKQSLEVMNNSGGILYQNENYEGDAWVFGFGKESSQPKWNDRVSSVQLIDGTEVTLYQNSDYTGDEITITEDTANIGDDMNDRASGIKW
jgi:hypothetical protein